MVHTDDHITEKIAGYHLMHLVMILCYVAYLDNSGIINQILHTSAHVRCTSNERWYVGWINNWKAQSHISLLILSFIFFIPLKA